MNPVYVEVEIQSNNHEYALDVNEIKHEMTLDLNENITIGGRLPWFDGSYTVAPRKEEQTLKTKNKSMSNDVTIEAIHYSIVSNPSGGLTANIGYE